MTNADKEKLASLRQEQEELNKSINEKQERIHKILGEIRAINLKDYRQKLKNLDIKQGSIMIGFARSPAYHYDMIEAIQVTEVSSNPSFRSIDYVSYIYRADDSDYSFHTSMKSMSIKQITEWLSEHLVYTISASDFMLILEHMAALKINHENVDKLPALIETFEDSNKMNCLGGKYETTE